SEVVETYGPFEDHEAPRRKCVDAGCIIQTQQCAGRQASENIATEDKQRSEGKDPWYSRQSCVSSTFLLTIYLALPNSTPSCSVLNCRARSPPKLSPITRPYLWTGSRSMFRSEPRGSSRSASSSPWTISTKRSPR